MIRVAKNTTAPLSLSTTRDYDGEDVKQTLHIDHFEKCYICERHLVTDYEIEHLKSQHHYPDLKQDWKNLFLVCRYCNGKKLNNYDDIIDPVNNNIEEQIKQEINFTAKKAVFSPNASSSQISTTIELLSKVFNGSNDMRKTKEERFFEHCLSAIIHFQTLVATYLTTPNAVYKKAIQEELEIGKELLGFKYWIIKSNLTLMADFGTNIVWNKQ